MRIVVRRAQMLALALLLLLPVGVFASDAPTSEEANAESAAPAARGGSDTSVYKLQHGHARQVIGRVKTALADAASCTGSCSLSQTLVLMPTSADDAIVAICPARHAELVKAAIASCDVLKQYAIRVQVYEVSDNGKTAPIGASQLIIGREGSVQCKAAGESLSVNFKVNSPDEETADLVPPGPSDPETAEAANKMANDECVAAGRCRMNFDAPETCNQCPLSSGSCSGCKSSCSQASASCSKPGSCGGNCGASQCSTTDAPATVYEQVEETKLGKITIRVEGNPPYRRRIVTYEYKDGTPDAFTASTDRCECEHCDADNGACCEAAGCTANCSKGSCCQSRGVVAAGESRGCWSDEINDATCAAVHGHCPEASYEETLMEGLAPQAHGRFNIGVGFGLTPGQLILSGPMVWFNRGNEARCAGCTATGSCNSASCESGGCETSSYNFEVSETKSCASKSCNAVADDTEDQPAQTASAEDSENNPHPRTTVSGATIQLFLKGSRIPFQIGGAPAGRVQLNLTGVDSQTELSNDIPPAPPAPSGASCTDGCPNIRIVGLEEVQPAPAAPCSCEAGEDDSRAKPAEPPALLTLSQRKDPSTNLPENAPHWQEEMVKAFRDRRLSDLFEPQSGHDAASHPFGHLLAEFPKRTAASPTGHSLTVVDMPDRVRIFESEAPTVSHTLSEPIKGLACPNCREEFRAFLEEMFRGSEASEDVAQTSHTDNTPEQARDLPNVTHSKIETKSVSYPLRDLVLCDDAGRPVFDTCTMIDHLEAAVAPESWTHPSVSIQLDQQSVSLVIRQTAEVHQKIADHLRFLRRLQVKQLCNLLERISSDNEDGESADAMESAKPAADVSLGPGLTIKP